MTNRTTGGRSAAAAPRAREVRTVLLVEDDHDLQYLARRVLERLGFRVLTAADGEQGLQLFREHERDIDLVLSDAGLPKLDGMGLYRAVRERNARVSFLLSSGGYTPPPAGNACAELEEAIPFIPKPWTVPQLEEAIERALASSPARSIAHDAP